MSIFVENITRFRHKNINVNKILFCVKRAENSNIIINFVKFKLLIYNSSKIKYILHQIHTYVLLYTIIQSIKKVLIIENISLNAFYIKCVFNLVYVEIEIIHVDLIDQKQINFVKKFNDFNNNLTIFNIIY